MDILLSVDLLIVPGLLSYIAYKLSQKTQPAISQPTQQETPTSHNIPPAPSAHVEIVKLLPDGTCQTLRTEHLGHPDIQHVFSSPDLAIRFPDGRIQATKDDK